jgi:hypothetical protein
MRRDLARRSCNKVLKTAKIAGHGQLSRDLGSPHAPSVPEQIPEKTSTNHRFELSIHEDQQAGIRARTFANIAFPVSFDQWH